MRCLRCAERRCMCGQVLWVMHEARCAADVAHGRECCEWKKGTQMEEGEAKERAVEEGLKYAKRDAAAYEARCVLEAEAEVVKRAAAVKRAEAAIRAEAAQRAETAGRIWSGELMRVTCVETAGGACEAVDVEAGAREFREAGVWCVVHEGGLYVETGNAEAASEGGARVVSPAAGGWAAAKGAK